MIQDEEDEERFFSEKSEEFQSERVGTACASSFAS